MTDTLTRHRAWKAALHPVALRSVQRGEHPRFFRDAPIITDDAHAWGIAHIAAADMVSRGFTRMLPMEEVLAVDPSAPPSPYDGAVRLDEEERSALYSRLVRKAAA